MILVDQNQNKSRKLPGRFHSGYAQANVLISVGFYLFAIKLLIETYGQLFFLLLKFWNILKTM